MVYYLSFIINCYFKVPSRPSFNYYWCFMHICYCCGLLWLAKFLFFCNTPYAHWPKLGLQRKKIKTVDFVGGLVEDHDWSAINYDSSNDFFKPIFCADSIFICTSSIAMFCLCFEIILDSLCSVGVSVTWSIRNDDSDQWRRFAKTESTCCVRWLGCLLNLFQEFLSV